MKQAEPDDATIDDAERTTCVARLATTDAPAASVEQAAGSRAARSGGQEAQHGPQQQRHRRRGRDPTMSMPSSCARRSNTASNSRPGRWRARSPAAPPAGARRCSGRAGRPPRGRRRAATAPSRAAPARRGLLGIEQHDDVAARLGGPAQEGPARDVARQHPQLGNRSRPGRSRSRGCCPCEPALTARISNGRPRRAEVRRDVADLVADRVLVVADGDHHGELGLAMTRCDTGGTPHG